MLADVAGSRIRTGLREDDPCGTLIPRPDEPEVRVAGFRASGEAAIPVRSNSTGFFGYFLSIKKVTSAREVRHDLHPCERAKASQNIFSPSGDSLLFAEKEVSKKRCRNQTRK